jgi:hypothetical protein
MVPQPIVSRDEFHIAVASWAVPGNTKNRTWQSVSPRNETSQMVGKRHAVRPFPVLAACGNNSSFRESRVLGKISARGTSAKLFFRTGIRHRVCLRKRLAGAPQPYSGSHFCRVSQVDKRPTLTRCCSAYRAPVDGRCRARPRCPPGMGCFAHIAETDGNRAGRHRLA